MGSCNPGYFVCRKVLALLVVCGLCGVQVHAQELDCGIRLDYSQVSGTDTSTLDDLENRIDRYVNERSWTNHEVRRNERISCSMQIVIEDEPSRGEYEAQIVVSARRPIYGTAQSSTVLRVNDTEWSFSYGRGESLEYNLNRHDPLTSVLDFYAYLIIGMDFDTFDEHGGTPYLEQSRDIADRARSAPGSSGWDSFGTSRGRTDLVETLLGSRHQEFRSLVFRYHYRGLDRFVEDTDAAREELIEVLRDIEEFENSRGRTEALDHFFGVKYQEFAVAFEQSNMAQEAHALLTQVDPSHASTYNNTLN